MTYKEAYQEACTKALRYGYDYGIAKDAFGGFYTLMLPKTGRCGTELSCEVVTPDLAKAMQKGDGTFVGGGT